MTNTKVEPNVSQTERVLEVSSSKIATSKPPLLSFKDCKNNATNYNGSDPKQLIISIKDEVMQDPLEISSQESKKVKDSDIIGKVEMVESKFQCKTCQKSF